MPSADALKQECYYKLLKKEERRGAWRGRVIKITETDYLSGKFKLEFEEPIDNVMMTPGGRAFKSHLVVVGLGVSLIVSFLYLLYTDGVKGLPIFPSIGIVLILLIFLFSTYISDKTDSIGINSEGITLNGKRHYWEDDIMSTAILESIGNNYTRNKLVLFLNNNESIVYDIDHFGTAGIDFTHEISAYIQYFRNKHVKG